MNSNTETQAVNNAQLSLDFESNLKWPITAGIENPNSPYKAFEMEYLNMPPIIKRLAGPQPSAHETAMVCFAAMVVLSGLMTRVSGVYHYKIVYPNLFFIVLAAAASGKSTLSLSRKLLQPVHESIITESKRLEQLYRTEMLQYQNAIKRGNPATMPARPPFRVVLIPADITPSRLVQHLADADGITPTILIEEEIDTSTASKKAGGDFSYVLRKAASGETISLSRKGENQYVECNNPKLALIMSGTMDQITGLIRNAEDGLYSRSLFYHFDAGVEWQNVAPCPECVNLSDLFKNAGLEFLAVYQYLSRGDTEVRLTETQWTRLNEFGESHLHRLYNFHGEETSALAKRHALMVFKICMVLSGIRKFEQKNDSPVIYCTDQDFQIAMSMVSESLKSSLYIIRRLPKATSEKDLGQKKAFFEQLPDRFTRKEFVDIAYTSMGISNRTADRSLQNLITANYLKKLGQGVYEKIPVANLAMANN